MRPDTARASAGDQLDLGAAGNGLAVLLEASERAIEQLGVTFPSAQVRALLIIDRRGSMNLSRLAEALRATASAASRLCDRMQAAGLLTRDRAAASRREIVLVPTESGRQLAQSVRDSHRSALRSVLQTLSQDGQEALVRALSELAAAQPR
jgi:DNA-binding MarR family transcriptional regulator